MRRMKLGTQLNISFALVLVVPMLIATVFSIVYHSYLCVFVSWLEKSL